MIDLYTTLTTFRVLDALSPLLDPTPKPARESHHRFKLPLLFPLPIFLLLLLFRVSKRSLGPLDPFVILILPRTGLQSRLFAFPLLALLLLFPSSFFYLDDQLQAGFKVEILAGDFGLRLGSKEVDTCPDLGDR